MAQLILITGGSRSGKSAHAQQMAEQVEGPRLFIATCPHTDREIDARIRRHQADRQGRGWETVEEPVLLVETLASVPSGTTILVDCLTLWINNLMYTEQQRGRKLTEAGISELADRLAGTALCHNGKVILVTNEVGLGIVPDNAAARRYRDLVGRCNQIIAGRADQVFLVTCGIAQRIKG